MALCHTYQSENLRSFVVLETLNVLAAQTIELLGNLASIFPSYQHYYSMLERALPKQLRQSHGKA